MTTTRLTLLLSLGLLASACKKGEGDQPAATGSATTTPGSAAAAPPECKDFLAAFDALEKCDKLSATARAGMKASNEKMLKAMQDLGDAKASADGCKQGLSSLQGALKLAGC